MVSPQDISHWIFGGVFPYDDQSMDEDYMKLIDQWGVMKQQLHISDQLGMFLYVNM